MSGWLTTAADTTRQTRESIVRAWGTMTAATNRLPRLTTRPVEVQPSASAVVLSYALSLASLFLLLMLVQVTLVSQFQHFTSQSALYQQLRLQLAEGSLPIGQTDVDGHVTRAGAPIALLSIPALDVREVIVEGSASAQTATGVGHRRDTPLPGQPGVSVLLGRATGYGGVFGALDTLQPGSVLEVTTGQGVSTYRVIGVRTPESQLPALDADGGRLTLTTAAGPPFMPNGVTRVDAQLESTAFPRPAPVIGVGYVTESEAALGSDTSGLFALSWLAELFVALVVFATWAWKRWPKRAVWLIFAPVLLCAELAVTGELAYLLPNIL